MVADHDGVFRKDESVGVEDETVVADHESVLLEGAAVDGEDEAVIADHDAVLRRMRPWTGKTRPWSRATTACPRRMKS